MDITGRRFDRMSVARKSMIQLKTTTLTSSSSNGGNKLSAGPSPPTSSGTPNDEDEIEVLLDETAVVVDEATGEVQTVRRRSRTRKPRGRRRNTLAGTDQREIEEAATAVNGFVWRLIVDTTLTQALSGKHTTVLVNAPPQSSLCLHSSATDDDDDGHELK